MNQAVKIVVKGKVQGVCFRAAAQKQAVKLGIKGWVKNVPTGEVEIKAVAKKADLEQLIVWCYKGSVFARVDTVAITPLHHVESFTDFAILKD